MSSTKTIHYDTLLHIFAGANILVQHVGHVNSACDRVSNERKLLYGVGFAAIILAISALSVATFKPGFLVQPSEPEGKLTLTILYVK